MCNMLQGRQTDTGRKTEGHKCLTDNVHELVNAHEGNEILVQSHLTAGSCSESRTTFSFIGIHGIYVG